MRLNPTGLAVGTSAVLAALAAFRPFPQSATPPITVPFELRSDLALVRAEVNGQSALLILDSGSGVNVVDSALAASAQLDMSGPRARVMGRSDATMQLGRARSLRVGAAELRDALVAPSDLAAVQARVGRDVRGTIGYDLFARYVVVVDYRRRQLTLHDPGTFAYTGTGVVLPVTTATRVPITDAVLVTRRMGRIPVRLNLDLGSSAWAVRLGTRVVEKYGLDEDTATVRAPFGAGVGGASVGKLLRLPELRLGPLVIGRPSTALSSDSTGAFGRSASQDGTVGVPVFRRTLVIFDYARSRVILEPRERLDLPDSVDASGLSLTVGQDSTGPLGVEYVVSGSAAADAGIRAGDELLRVDDRTASATSLHATRLLLRTAGTTRRLTIRRGESTLTVSIVLRWII